MAIITRASKGSALTHTEMDTNLKQIPNGSSSSISEDSQNINFSKPLYAISGAVDNLSIKLGDTDIGFFDSGANAIGVVTGGVHQADFRGCALVAKNQCTAWVNFSGFNGSIRDSFNVSSVTRTELGKYTITIDQDFDNDDYAVAGMAQNSNNNVAINSVGANLSTTSIPIRVVDADGSSEERENVTIIVFGGRDV